MAENNNILLVTDYEEIAKSVLEKLVLLRDSDRLTICNTKNFRKTLSNSMFSIVILHETDYDDFTLKLISNIKETKFDTEILLLLNEVRPQLILKAYDLGIFDYFTMDANEYDILIKAVNCFKMRTIKEISKRNEKFLYQQGIIDEKTNLYQYKHLKDTFPELADNLQIQNGIFCIVTLDGNTKNKISLNRLAGAIKNSVRLDDITAVGKAGKFYIIIPNIDLDGAKDVIKKIQIKMGDEFWVRAGLSQIGTNSFDTLDKNASDSLTIAIKNEVMTASIENKNNQDNWLEDDENSKVKNFKLFKKIFNNKLNNVITPVFYRHQKSFENKLPKTIVSQYANDIESVFSLKGENLLSELTIHYNGYAKFKIEIKHSGLESAENSKMEIPLKDLTDKLLTSLLKNLKDEFKQSMLAKGNEDA